MKDIQHHSNKNSNKDCGKANPAFEFDQSRINLSEISDQKEIQECPPNGEKKKKQDGWNNDMEFLMSCIALSVGLGNIWRFPFTAFENGRGAFLVAYLIVLTFVGRPFYYLETALGQFSGKACVKIWECVPLLKGIGYSQIIASAAVLSYYCAIMAITLFYFFASFSSTLPWTECKDEWEFCLPSSFNGTLSNRADLKSSSELYFLKEVLHEADSIENGIGVPDWRLALCLFLTWVILFLVSVRGVQSSGRASYFLAVFPYVILITLMVRGCILPGAKNGIIAFFKPVWSDLVNPQVWYAAVTQAFFSLGTSFGALITYASYNNFRHNIHRDALIVTGLDTFTSIIAGITIFAILGNLAYERGVDDIGEITKGGVGLAFVSYPEATAKFGILPQLFAVMFFLMLFILGAGSTVPFLNMVVKVFIDRFPNSKSWMVALVFSIVFFLLGLVYVTPGGQSLINLVNYYAGSFNIFIIACVEIIGISWIYGYKNVCRDLEFMLKQKVGLYWKVTWALSAPVTVILIFIQTLVSATEIKYNGQSYPKTATVSGWVVLLIGFLQIPLWGIYELCRREGSIWDRLRSSTKPSSEWGPEDPEDRRKWEEDKIKSNGTELSDLR